MNVRPVVYDTSGKYHAPAPQGSKLDYDLINVDELVSGQANNALSKDSEGRLFVNGVPPHVSKEPWNYVRFGNDHGIFVGGNDVLSNSEVNLLTIADGDKKVVLTPDAVEGVIVNTVKSNDEVRDEIADIISEALLTNATVRDTVSRLIADAISKITIVSKDSGNMLAAGSDGGAMLVLSGLLSSATDNALKPGPDGKIYLNANDVAGGVSVDLGNLLVNGSDGRPYLTGDFGSM